MTRLLLATLVFLLWLLVTVGGGTMITQGHGELGDLVQNGIGWHFLAACLLLVAAIMVFRWRDIPFGPVPVLPTIRLMWLPLVVLAGWAVVSLFAGLPPGPAVFFIAVNTLMVGFSEETMLRGVLFSALKRVTRLWPAIIITSVLFGAMHSLNVFTTGALLPALAQSLSAAMLGLLMVAIVIRTGSLWPAILYHGAWDCFIFFAASGQPAEPADAGVTLATFLVPILIEMPNFLYGLWLLRKVGKDGKIQS